jgi:hypothetical protein
MPHKHSDLSTAGSEPEAPLEGESTVRSEGSSTGHFDERLEENIDLSPSDTGAAKAVAELVRLATKMPNPRFGDITKAIGAIGGWLWQPRKAERAGDLVLGLYERLERTRSEYLKKEEAQDLFENVLRRIAEQPDASRRENMRKVFYKIIDAPLEHVENRLLLRLADELPSWALNALAVLDHPLTDEEREMKLGTNVLASRLGISPIDATSVIRYLINENIFGAEDERFVTTVGFGAAGDDLMFLLTPLGRTFVKYVREP